MCEKEPDINRIIDSQVRNFVGNVRGNIRLMGIREFAERMDINIFRAQNIIEHPLSADLVDVYRIAEVLDIEVKELFKNRE